MWKNSMRASRLGVDMNERSARGQRICGYEDPRGHGYGHGYGDRNSVSTTAMGYSVIHGCVKRPENNNKR